VVARESVDVTAETPGRLRAIYVTIGDAVQRGDRVASLDASIAGQDLEMARSSLRAAEADANRVSEELAEARVRSERRQTNPELFSKEELAEVALRVKTATAALEVSRARVSEQRARVRQLEAALGQTEVRAPFAGRVAERFVDVGAVVGPGTALVRLISSGDLLVRAAVPPEEARGLAQGAVVTVTPRNTRSAVPAVIERVAPEVDAASQMVLIEIRTDRSAASTGGLQAGQVVDVRPGAGRRAATRGGA
jgi:RND family efflux transporter MFP subunit